MLLARTPAGIGAAFTLEEFSQLKLKSTAQCSFGSYSVTSGELQTSLARPNVEVKFSNNMVYDTKRGGADLAISWQLVVVGMGGLLGNCLVYDFR